MHDVWLLSSNYFLSLLCSSDLVIWGLKHLDTRYLVNATPPTVLAGSFLNFAGVFVKV